MAKNQSCLITGAAGGIGAALARRLAAQGTALVLSDLDGDRLASLETELSGLTEVTTKIADMTVESDIAALVDTALRHHGTLDQLALVAGIEGTAGDLEETTPAGYERIMAVNTTSAFVCLRAVLPRMKAARRGAVVATASTAGLNAVAGYGPYSVSKHALIGLTRAAAVEAGPFGVRVNAVLPGPIATEMMTRIRRDAPSTSIGGGTLLGRMGTPDEAAAVIAFLLSDDASFVTNSYWTVDGGRLAV